jgi:hypothetical protein
MMATWLIPALKAILPHIGTIVSATAPAFTQKRADASPDQTHLLQQQITELQTAASQNATHVKELAAQLQRTITAIEEAALAAKATQQRALMMSIAAVVVSVISLSLVVIQRLVL